MEATILDNGRKRILLYEMIGAFGFVFLILSMATIIYFDDIQITLNGATEEPSIFNIRIAGLKLLDLLALILTVILLLQFIVHQKIIVTRFHYHIITLFAIYAVAGVVGFIYSFWLRYDYLDWLQDLQPFLYLNGFFFYTFYFVTTKKRWYYFVGAFIAFMAAKNILILYKSLSGTGISMFFGIIRSSQNSEFSYFPMMFFPLVILLFHTMKTRYRSLIILCVSVYLANTVMGMVRTVWVILAVGMIYLFMQLDRKYTLRISGFIIVLLLMFVVALELIFPTSMEYLWKVKFLSIIDWNFSGNLSNAIRMVQIVNVWDWVISNFAFLQGMGLGAWWEETARRMLPNVSTEYHLRAHFRKTDVLIVTQFLKIGLIGIIIYWYTIYKIVRDTKALINQIPYEDVDRKILLGLLIGLMCGFLSQADFVRLFLMIGICVGIIASYHRIESFSQSNTITAV